MIIGGYPIIIAFFKRTPIIMVVDKDQIWYRRVTMSNMVIVRFAKFGIMVMVQKHDEKQY